MARPKPIVKIKRGITTPTIQLTAGELGVDLATNRLYIGIASPGNAVAIGAEVDTAITLGGTNTSDNKIATEKAAKDYITSKLVVGTQAPKDTLFATILANPAANASPVPQNIDLSSAVISQSTNMNLLRADPNSNPTGFYQTTKTEMILNVTYSLQISAINTGTLEGTNNGYWRLAGLRVIDTNTINTTSLTTYYGMQVVLPVIGNTSTPTFPLPTLISGNACVRLPKYVSGGTQWELQLVYQLRSTDGLLDIGTGGFNNFVNDPEIGAAKGIRIQIVKISESAT